MNREEVLTIVAEGRESGVCPDLSGANLCGTNLCGTNLSGANLSVADLRGANLSGADLYGASLYRADLSEANLSGANLYRANLSEANLSGAYLSGTNLSGAYLYGARGILEIGPGGSRGDMLYAVAYNDGPRIWTGCFWGTVAEFRDAVLETHSENNHAAYYTACIVMIEAWWKAYGEATDGTLSIGKSAQDGAQRGCE